MPVRAAAPLRLAFMGSPGIARGVLEALMQAGHEIACVYTQPPRPAGRGRKLSPTAVHGFAEACGLPVRVPASLRSDAEQEAFRTLGLDAAVVVAYGLILPREVLDAPRLGCLNLHASILPRWRGAAPVQRAIMAGDTETGIDAMIMEAGLDTGPVVASVRTPILAADTAGSLHDRLAQLAASLAPEAIAGLAAGRLRPVPQPEEGMCYAAKITAADQKIDWTRPAAETDCHIRGLAPLPGAWCEAVTASGPVRLKVLFSQLIDGQSGDSAGTLMDDRLAVACGDGRMIRLLRVQKPGGRPMEAEEFLSGMPLPRGTRLS